MKPKLTLAIVDGKPTTKVCPRCNNTRLILLHSVKKKLCADCKLEFDWPLDEGQKPTY